MHIKLKKIIPFTGIGAGVFIILCEVFTLLYTGRIFGYFALGLALIFLSKQLMDDYIAITENEIQLRINFRLIETIKINEITSIEISKKYINVFSDNKIFHVMLYVLKEEDKEKLKAYFTNLIPVKPD